MDSHERNPENQFLGVMQQYLAYEGWDDDIAIAEDGDASIKTTTRFDGQILQLYLEGWASIQTFKVYLYSSFSVPPHRHDEIAIRPNHPARPSLADFVGRLQVGCSLPMGGGRHHFFQADPSA